MCRSIKTLRGAAPVSDEDMHAAALQYVRKVSGYRVPSGANQEPFEAAVERVTAATAQLLAELQPGRRAARAPAASCEPT